MTEEIINYPNNDQHSTLQHQNQQYVGTEKQVEWISKFLTECPEAAQNVQQYLQNKYSIQQQQREQPANSTPKRSRPLDESGGSTNNGRGRRHYSRKRFQQSKENAQDSQQTITTQLMHQPIQPVINQNKRLPFEQLKHAVSSNLPCFHIKFGSISNGNIIPSAIHASDLICRELQLNGVTINRFTLVGWAGQNLKLGVNNKTDYAVLVETDKWPTKINGIDIEVIKPRFTPDSFALVVRYVPRELDDEFVANEIKRTIASADRIKRINYAYQRKSNDYRFDAKDYQEYNAALKLGRIGIGYSWLSITPFFPGNRLTYCTQCWCIGHLRNKCNEPARCRVCLESLMNGSSHVCKNEPKCAQCDGKPHSLDNQCQVIQDYKQRLNEDVKQAINSGALHRFAPEEQVPSFDFQEQEFPLLKPNDKQPPRRWNMEQDRIESQPNATTTLETEKALENINIKLSQLLNSNQRVEEKVDQLTAELKTVTLDTQLHQAGLLDIITVMKEFIQHFITPLLTSSKMDRLSLIPVAQQFYNRFHSSSVRLNDGFQLNRKISSASADQWRNISPPNQGFPLISNTTATATSNKYNV